MTADIPEFKPDDALLIIDVQRCFCAGGDLPIPDGDAVVPVINQYIKHATAAGIPIYASRDWHPVRHISFKEGDGPWPPHCIQDSEQAGFHPGLALPPQTQIITKGVRLDQDQTSAFDQTGLARQLANDGVRHVWVCGLALDVCVLASVMDALEAGLQVTLIESATRPVTSEGGRRAKERMAAAGAAIV